MKKETTRNLVISAMLGAVALILSFLSFPVIPAAPFLKIDFGDIPILLGMFAMGPKEGVLINLVRWVLHYLLTGGEAGIPIGDTAGFIASLSLTLPLYYSIKYLGLNLKGRMVGTVVSSLSLTTVLSILNYFVLVPAYMAVMNLDVGPMREYLLAAVIPFNLVKGILVSVAFYVVWAAISPWVEKKFANSKV